MQIFGRRLDKFKKCVDKFKKCVIGWYRLGVTLFA